MAKKKKSLLIGSSLFSFLFLFRKFYFPSRSHFNNPLPHQNIGHFFSYASLISLSFAYETIFKLFLDANCDKYYQRQKVNNLYNFFKLLIVIGFSAFLHSGRYSDKNLFMLCECLVEDLLYYSRCAQNVPLN